MRVVEQRANALNTIVLEWQIAKNVPQILEGKAREGAEVIR